ncbi:MAG TPA: NAD(P)-binding domain-containing protein, partial [Candidatus Saccharimonadales bacterium]|nr:NAD(P)-binding domain-containing protein [Candidatus Saccharimonadales bacterium]
MPILEQLRARIEGRTAKIGVVGLGYVGLPLALLFSEQRFPITGFDIDAGKVGALNSGGSYIYRIPATEIAAARAAGFSATSDYTQVAAMDAILICVPTPLNEYREPDLSYIRATAEAVAPHLRAGQIVILESTTYPGTTEEVLAPILEARNPGGLKAARGDEDPSATFMVAFSPEREDPGNDTVARRDIPKVVGGLSRSASE